VIINLHKIYANANVGYNLLLWNELLPTKHVLRKIKKTKEINLFIGMYNVHLQNVTLQK